MLATTVDGEGDQVVLALHDWMGDHRNYDPCRPYLDLSARRWVFADLRGYGRSKALPGTYTLDEAASDVAEILEGLPGAVHLVGHSMSSLVAQEVAARLPERLASLVLVAPVNPAGMGTPADVLPWLENLGGSPEARAEALGPRFEARHGPGWARFKLRQWADSAAPEAARGYVRMFARESVTRPLPSSLPVLAVLGSADPEPFTESTVRAGVGAAWPGLQLEVCEGAGHYPMQETPARFAATVEAFLADRVG